MPPSKRMLIGLGLLSTGMGVIPLLTGLGFIAAGSGGSDSSPPWVALLSGLLFVFAGMAVMLKALTRAGESPGGLPSGAPRSLCFVYDLLVLAIAGSLAAIASWVAFGSGERHFSGFTNFGGFTVDTSFGRTMFGIGAVLTWFLTAALLLDSARRWFSRR